ncbi:acyl-CoA thioesterase [Deinococcus wulumuqiensis]|uniref:Acyl-CoA thioesterase n=1 Tax=Deinococcus wulumuqiensis TaxID=980427 RepID=A0A345IKZ5_9DEIO|nr:acyl-CoA thioesterase [Deinococcus wulumuqiensis]AXH00368.1 acyl-CoA thioesterase [Deinococcus wulumuqiensis]QII22151.1 acyl-CoA thioesterase [Deinococcus wulumuqiensis R12]GGI68775.1 acyl-CoA thioesterase [Deinococcus wulumuqiensis]GGI86532.1 acyl-CoA thioesterase [Deinococcus wulumuqiensis]
MPQTQDLAPLSARSLPQSSETRVTHVVFPGDTNHHGTLFGGEALSMMDSAAFICATRHCRRKVVTRHLDAMEFSRPIPQGTLVELVARVVRTGRSSMTVLVELFVEDMYSERRELGCTGTFTLVALGDDGQPTPVPPVKVVGDVR